MLLHSLFKLFPLVLGPPFIPLSFRFPEPFFRLFELLPERSGV
jgi:hypothetical protein